METMLGILGAIYTNEIAYAFSLTIAGLFLFSLIASFLPTTFGSGIIAITPNLLATLGVLGTFVGILVGLIDFDVTRIDASVPHLLAGLKIAFATSIVGMSTSIAFRLLTSFTPTRATAGSISPTDIYQVLTEIRNAIASDGDASLVTQVQKLRTSVQDNNDALIKEFRQFAEHMTENNQRAVIEALEAVIRDFNTQLNEQFGDNFRQLNEAVGKLVVWQEQYRVQMEELAQRLETGTQAIERAEVALAAVKSHTEAIPDAVSALLPVMQVLNDQTTYLQELLRAVADLRTKAIDAFPLIEQNLKTITDDLSTSVQSAYERTLTTVEQQSVVADTLQKAHQELLQDVNSAQDTFTQEFRNALQTMSRETNETINAQIDRLDRGLEQELKRAMEKLGGGLASMSEKFVSDYGPLTEQLRQIVELSREARN